MAFATPFSDHFAVVRLIAGALAIAALTVSGAAHALDIFDNFSDHNDTANPTWTHLNNAVASTDQIWDASSGAYHLSAPSNSTHPLLAGYGFVGAYTGPTYTDVRVTADIIDFPGATSDEFALGGFMGVAARLDGNNGTPIEGGGGIQLHGYSYQYEANARGGAGEMVLNILHGGGFKDIRSNPISLDPAKDYRFVLECVGNTLLGQVYEIDGSGAVVAFVGENFRDLDVEPVGNINHDGDPGTPEEPFVPYTSGYSGLFAVGHAFLKDADYTVDNFRSESLALLGDFDHDRDVDAADLTQWRGDFGLNGDSDADMDADSDGTDLLVWQRHLGEAAPPPGAAAVPEPTSLGLLGCAIGVAMLARRHRW